MSTQNSRFWVTGEAAVGLGTPPTTMTLAKLKLLAFGDGGEGARQWPAPDRRALCLC